MRGQGTEQDLKIGEWFSYHLDIDLPKIEMAAKATVTLDINTMHPDKLGKHSFLSSRISII